MSGGKIVMIILLLVVLVLGLGLSYIGVFSKVNVSEVKTGPYLLAYEEHVGDYKETKNVQDRVYKTLIDEYGIETYKGFSYYYDNPKNVPKEELRSIAGCIIEEKDYESIDKIQESGIKIKRLNKKNSILSEFPLKNPLSVLVGIMKVHPKILSYAKSTENGHEQIMEIYDVPNKKIIYIIRAK